MSGLKHAGHLGHVGHAAHMLEKAKNPIEGAAAGAMMTGIGAPAVLGMIGFALTPLGWAVALGGGAAAGAAIVANKLKNR